MNTHMSIFTGELGPVGLGLHVSSFCECFFLTSTTLFVTELVTLCFFVYYLVVDWLSLSVQSIAWKDLP